MEDIPSGNSGEIAREYFQHLYSHYLQKTTQTYYVHWDILLAVLFWIVMLAALFFLYTRWQRSTQSKGEPYPVESYNGYIQETNGPVGPFLMVFFGVMFIWLAIVTIMSLTNGQIY